MNKPTISIGIPAFNEEANIKQLLESLLNQTQENIELLEIIVVSDASTDRTVQIIKELGNPKITVIENETRVGQALGQNKIIKMFSGEILVLLNADILPADKDFLEKIVEPFSRDPKIGIVCPEIMPVRAITFFEKIINYSVRFKKSMFSSINNGSNLFMCVGAARAFRGDFAKMIEWSTSLSEDAYSYLLCISKGNKFIYLPSTAIYYKSPDNLTDHIKQSARFLNGAEVMSKYFPKSFVDTNYNIPLMVKVKGTLKFALLNPVLFFLYFCVLILSKLKSYGKNSNASNLWSVSESSKKLN